MPGVFAPQLTFSTKVLLGWAERLPLKDKSFLELGSGCGVISVMAAKRGAITTACDINPAAVENTKLNAELNKVEINTVLSDMFAAVEYSHFDFIFINPPYYPKNPANQFEKAWYCGENFEYFEKLFSQLSDRNTMNSAIYLILSDECELEKIGNMANQYSFTMKEMENVRNWFETNYVFKIVSE